MSAELRQKPLISVEVAADHIGISRSAAYRWARLGCLPGAVNIGGRWYVRRAVLLAWLAGQDVAGTTPAPDELAAARNAMTAVRPVARGGA